MAAMNATKRDAILAAALAEFSGQGYFGARIDRIATSASANKQLIFHYFGSKDGLYEAAVSKLLSGVPAPIDKPASAPDALRRHVTDTVRWFAATPGAAKLLSECLSMPDLPEGAVSVARRWTEAEYGALLSIVNSGQMSGYFRDDIDCLMLSELVVSAAVGHVLHGHDQRLVTTGGSSIEPALGRIVVDYCAWR